MCGGPHLFGKYEEKSFWPNPSNYQKAASYIKHVDPPGSIESELSVLVSRIPPVCNRAINMDVSAEDLGSRAEGSLPHLYRKKKGNHH